MHGRRAAGPPFAFLGRAGFSEIKRANPGRFGRGMPLKVFAGRADIPHITFSQPHRHMYSPAMSSPFGRVGAMANAYRQVGVETGVEAASPHRLIAMLFDGYMEAIASARGAMRNGQIEAKGRAISRAARIVEEGLKSALNLNDGGQLAQDLRALYDYLTMRLTQANLRNDEKILDECQRLMEPLRDAWREIGQRAPALAN